MSPSEIDFHPAWWLVVIVVAVSHLLLRRLPLWHETLPSWIFSVGFGVSVAFALLFVRFEARPFIYFQF